LLASLYLNPSIGIDPDFFEESDFLGTASS
jgi:hypothetical protein